MFQKLRHILENLFAVIYKARGFVTYYTLV